MQPANAASVEMIGVAAGFAAGWRHRQFQLALQENMTAAANLQFYTTNLCPGLREYLKARIYCNVRNYYPSDPGYLIQREWDFGPVDQQVLGPILVWKDPDGKVFDWGSAIRDKQ